MTKTADDPLERIAEEHEEAARERSQFSYVGHALPWPVMALWAAFLLFGLCYFLAQL